MIRSIILVLTLTLVSTQFSIAQFFDQAKYNTMIASSSKKPSKISSKVGKKLIQISQNIAASNFETALNIANELSDEDLSLDEQMSVDQFFGIIYGSNTDYEASIQAYLRVLKNPNVSFTNYKQFNNIIGYSYLNLNDHDNAIKYFNEYLSIEEMPSWSTYRMIIGSYIHLGKFKKAAEYVSIANDSFSNTLANYNEEQRIRYKSRIDTDRRQINATSETIKRALAGEEVEKPEAIPTSSDALSEDWPGDVQIVRLTNPVYPKQAVEEKIEGWVLLSFDIDDTGNAVNASVTESTHKVFEKSALNAISKYEFKILKNKNDKGYLINTKMRIEFNLR